MERPVDMGQDLVSPPFDRKVSFEAKYAIDSIACFLQLCRIYHQQTLDSSFVTDDCLGSTKAILQIIREQRDSTYTEYGALRDPTYSFMRLPAISLESPYNGPESPSNSGTSLVRSSFR